MLVWFSAGSSACTTEDRTPVGTGGSVTSGGTASGGAGQASGGAGQASGGTAVVGGATGGTTSTGGLGGGAGFGAGGLGGGALAGSAGGPSAFVLTSPAFENVEGCSVESPRGCDVFPDVNVSYADNANVSPELHWAGAPEGTKSFALVLFDATFGQAHWALWNIPAEATTLAADVPKDTATPATPLGSRQANANFATTGGDGYFGPHVPCNVFEFQLYALSLGTFSPAAPESSVLVSIELQELGAPVLASVTLRGRSNDYQMPCE